MAFFRIDCDSTVIAHMLMGSGGDIEQGCLAAVRIADQGNADDVAAFLGQFPHLFVQSFCIAASRLIPAQIAGSGIGRACIAGNRCLCSLLCPGLALADDLYLLGLLPAQGYLVAYYLILYGVLKRGVEHDPYLLALDESHLGDTLAEGAVAAYLDYDASFACL